MQTRIRQATLSIALVFGLVSLANAQLKAGSPEEAAYTKIEAERNSDAKLTLLLDFEKTYPSVNPRVMANIFMMAMDIYSEKDNKPKISEYGDKAIAKDPENLSALLRVSLNYSRERTNIPKAVDYAQKAKDIVAGMRSQPTPLGQTEDQWKKWLDDNAKSADQYHAYAKQLQAN